MTSYLVKKTYKIQCSCPYEKELNFIYSRMIVNMFSLVYPKRFGAIFENWTENLVKVLSIEG